MSVGQKYGIRNAGYYALRSLRIEKFFAFWGQDLNTLTSPLECGRESRVKLEKVLCPSLRFPSRKSVELVSEGVNFSKACRGVGKSAALTVVTLEDLSQNAESQRGDAI